MKPRIRVLSLILFNGIFVICNICTAFGEERDWTKNATFSLGITDPSYVEIKNIKDAEFGKINIIPINGIDIDASIKWVVKRDYSIKDTNFLWNGIHIGSGSNGMNNILVNVSELDDGSVLQIPYNKMYTGEPVGSILPFDPLTIDFKSEFLKLTKERKILVLMPNKKES